MVLFIVIFLVKLENKSSSLSYYSNLLNDALSSTKFILCLSVCLFVSNKPQNLSGPTFLRQLTWSQGRFMDAQNYKICLHKCWYILQLNVIKKELTCFLVFLSFLSVPHLLQLSLRAKLRFPHLNKSEKVLNILLQKNLVLTIIGWFVSLFWRGIGSLSFIL